MPGRGLEGGCKPTAPAFSASERLWKLDAGFTAWYRFQSLGWLYVLSTTTLGYRMTRSIKHAPVVSQNPVPSEKLDKQRAHKARRALAQVALKRDDGDSYSEKQASVPLAGSKGGKGYSTTLRVRPEGKSLRVIQLPGGGFDGRKAHKAVAK